jgi:hypothetical protein
VTLPEIVDEAAMVAFNTAKAHHPFVEATSGWRPSRCSRPERLLLFRIGS